MSFTLLLYVYRACPRAAREIHISDSAAYFTGVGQNERTGVECLPSGISAVRRNPLRGIPQGVHISLGASYEERAKRIEGRDLSVGRVCLSYANYNH